MSFATEIKAHREHLGLTQAGAADLLGMSRRAYIELEMDRRDPRRYESEGIVSIFRKAKKRPGTSNGRGQTPDGTTPIPQ